MCLLGDISGFVDSITLASTKIKSFKGQIISIPNNTVWGSVIINNTANDIRCVQLPIRASYNDKISEVERTLLDIMNSHPLVLQEPAPSTFVGQYEEYYIQIFLKAWTKTSDYWTVYADILRTIQERFAQENLSIPIPQLLEAQYESKKRSAHSEIEPLLEFQKNQS